MSHLPLILLSLALFAAGAWSARKSSRRLTCVCFSLCGFSLVFFTGFFLISNSFTASGIDASVMYHLKYGLTGAGFSEYSGVMIASVAILLLAAATFAVCLRLLAPGRHRSAQFRAWPAQLMLGASFLVHPGVQNVYSLHAGALTQPSGTSRFGDIYASPSIKGMPSGSFNLVYIYAESLERTYFDDRLFPELVVKLKELEQNALSFTNIEQLSGTHWTIAGMVASQCAIPLVTASGGNSMSGIDRFLPGATCLGDVLRSKGYSLTFVGGADLNFAGKGKFLASHGFSEVLGKKELQGALSDPENINAWGLYDDFLLDHAFQRFEALAQADAPVALFALTLDTHHPKGHLSRRCGTRLYQDGKNDILNAVHCSDLLIAEFVDKLRRSPHAENTLIIIGSDHLAMNNTATDLLTKGDRKNLFMVIDPSSKRRGFVSKRGTTLDIAPTVLELLGYTAPAFGLGRSLLNNEASLIVQEENLSQTLAALSKDFAMFWEYPTLQPGLFIDARSQLLHIGERTLRLPTLLHVGPGNIVQNVFFAYQLFDYSEKLSAYVHKMDRDDAIVWIDMCRDLSLLEVPAKDDQFCAYLGTVEDHTPFITEVTDELFIPLEQISSIFSRPGRAVSCETES